MTTLNRNERIAPRRAELTRQRAAIPEDGALPLSTTRDEAARIVARRLALDQGIVNFDRVAAVYRECIGADADADARWKEFLVAARKTLCDERMQIKSPIRDRALKLRADGLEWGIRYIDHGLGSSTIGPVVTLEPTRLGELMAAAGYAVWGDALHGPRGWRGSLPEVERRIADLAKRRAAAEAALDEVLMSDEERAARKAHADELRAASNSLRMKGNADGTGLVAYAEHGEILDPSEMTPLQRKAFERANAAYASRREPAATTS